MPSVLIVDGEDLSKSICMELITARIEAAIRQRERVRHSGTKT